MTDLLQFQQRSLLKMIEMAMITVTFYKHKYNHLKHEVTMEILNFFLKFYQALRNIHLKEFEDFVLVYPNYSPLNPRTRAGKMIKEVNILEEWESRCTIAIESRMADIVVQERKHKAKQEAELLIQNDSDNSLIKDLMQSEMAPIKKTINQIALNQSRGESNSFKQTPLYQPNKKVKEVHSKTPTKTPQLQHDTL
jgi:hypothetical protein